jgi:hypothetical protein
MERVKKSNDQRRPNRETDKFKKQFGIDIHNLERESVQLPNDFAIAADEEACWWAEWENLKTKRAIAKSEVNLKLRGMALRIINLKYRLSLPKITEDGYQNLVRLDPKIRKLASLIIEAFTNAKFATAVREALVKKNNALDRCTSLHGQGYFKRKRR